MECPKCGFEQEESRLECLKCGIVFARYRAKDSSAPTLSPATESSLKSPLEQARMALRILLLPPPTDVGAAYLLARGFLTLTLTLWGGYFVFHGIDADSLGNSFMHLIHLPFHEAGHVFFAFFGNLMAFLGGTLGQILMPLICLGTFLLKNRDAHAASVCLWWLGQSFLDCAPYINDARDLKLTLVGGISAKDSAGHDWENILSSLGWMVYDHRIAVAFFSVGTLLMGISVLWAGLLLRNALVLRLQKRRTSP